MFYEKNNLAKRYVQLDCVCVHVGFFIYIPCIFWIFLAFKPVILSYTTITFKGNIKSNQPTKYLKHDKKTKFITFYTFNTIKLNAKYFNSKLKQNNFKM